MKLGVLARAELVDALVRVRQDERTVEGREAIDKVAMELDLLDPERPEEGPYREAWLRAEGIWEDR